MVKIIIENLGQKELVLTDLNKTALQQFQTQFIDWLQACGGKGRCTSCKMLIIDGMENLSELTIAEKNYTSQGLLKDNERLACQVNVAGNITVRVPEETKLPHLKYSS